MKALDERDSPWWLPPPGRLHPLWWAAIGGATLAIDYWAGPGSQFPAFYVVPVMVSAWYSGGAAAVGLAVVTPLVHALLLMLVWQPSANLTLLVSMTVLRGFVIAVMALWFSRLSEHERQLHRYVVRLEGLLPICSHCKSIRNEKGAWEPLEQFIGDRSDTDFTHGLCPNCLREHYSSH